MVKACTSKKNYFFHVFLVLGLEIKEGNDEVKKVVIFILL